MHNEFFDILLQARKKASDGDLTGCYHLLNIVLHRAVDARLAGSKIHFGGLFAKTDFLCKEHNVDRSVYLALNDFRHRKDEDQQTCWQQDVKCLALFLKAIFSAEVPEQLEIEKLRQAGERVTHVANSEVQRIIVSGWNSTTIFGRTDYGEDVEVPLPEGYDYFLKLLEEGDLINVVGDKILIYQPDYLVDISSVAGCFD